MQKSKHGPSLFDLLEESDNPAAGGSHGTEASTARHAGDGRMDEPQEPAPSPVVAASGRPVTGDAKARGPRFLELDGDRVLVSLTSATGAAAVFAAAVVFIVIYGWGYSRGEDSGVRAGYAAGRASYATGTASEIEAARSTPPVTYLVGGLLEETGGAGLSTSDATGAEAATGGDARSIEPAAVEWIRGYTYVVAQEFSAGHANDAGRAREFLAEGGIETATVRLPGGGVQLITAQGYDRSDPTQKRMADLLLEKVRTVGTRYYSAGGGYKFDGYFKTLKRDNW